MSSLQLYKKGINGGNGKRERIVVIYPVGFEVASLPSPIIGDLGIESHLLCKCEKKFLAILNTSPMTHLVHVLSLNGFG